MGKYVRGSTGRVSNAVRKALEQDYESAVKQEEFLATQKQDPVLVTIEQEMQQITNRLELITKLKKSEAQLKNRMKKLKKCLASLKDNSSAVAKAEIVPVYDKIEEAEVRADYGNLIDFE